MGENEVDVSSLEHFGEDDLTEIGLESDLALYLLGRVGPYLRGELAGGESGATTVAAGGEPTAVVVVGAEEEDPMEAMANEARRGAAVAMAAAVSPAPAPESETCYICGGRGHTWHDCPSSAEQQPQAVVAVAVSPHGNTPFCMRSTRSSLTDPS